ncbi:MAG: hypothetical protein ABR609_05475 [Acidimicrobiia bacterium]|nr:hypothetical protein [Acidimicrobiia bacterium]
MAWRPEDFDDLASHLRRQIGGELRDEAEEVERLTELGRARKRTLADVAQIAMHAGYQATVGIGEWHWDGSITGVGVDYLLLATDTVVVEAPFTALTLTLLRTRSGGSSTVLDSRTWSARLAEMAMAELSVTLLTDRDRFEGQIQLVATDHLEFEGGVYVLLENVKAVVRALV